MMRHAWIALVASACSTSHDAPPSKTPTFAAAHGARAPSTVSPAVPAPSPEIAPDRAPASPSNEVWLRGSTHVHARPSGDSATPISEVISWYETRGYDFIVLTDHNKVSEVGSESTDGKPWVRFPDKGLIVLAGTELTHNPTGCLPAGDATNACHIHANLLGVTARPTGKIPWAKHGTKQRLEKYTAALDQQKRLGGIAQVNHPQWHFGMTVDVLGELANRGFKLVEVANIQFKMWNRGQGRHPSTEALWDGVLAKGATLWGVASDDAHHYDGKGRWPAGGGWIVVKARRDPQAILDSIGSGRFYASTGVELVRAEAADGALVVEVAAAEQGKHEIAFVENGKLVETVAGKLAKRALPASGYVRAVVTRGDGKQAWVQPARR